MQDGGVESGFTIRIVIETEGHALHAIQDGITVDVAKGMVGDVPSLWVRKQGSIHPHELEPAILAGGNGVRIAEENGEKRFSPELGAGNHLPDFLVGIELDLVALI